MAKSFFAQLEGIRDFLADDMRHVASQAVQDVMEAAQTPQRGMTKGATSFVEGKIPVAEADLINSLTTEGAVGSESYTVAIAGYELGDVMRFAWTAKHALPMELGFTTSKGTRVPGRHFVGKNAARFSEFVTDRAKEIGR